MNSGVVSATNSQFNYDDKHPKLVEESSFGSYRVVSRDPFTVKYTIRAGVDWSDGTPVDAAELLLAWAANSGALNTPGFDSAKYVDQGTGKFTSDFPKNVVYFDGFSGMPKDRELVVGTGPYLLSGLVANDHATLTANPRYVGDQGRRFEKVTVKFISDPLAAVKTLKAGEVDVISP